MKNPNNKRIYSYPKYIPEHDEMRDWFKVSNNRKKIWNIQLGLIEELKKHNIKYYAEWWTLLWAKWHNCRYSVDKPYKKIIKSFDRCKSNKENCVNCADLFCLE